MVVRAPKNEDDPCLEGNVWEMRQVGKWRQDIKASQAEPSKGMQSLWLGTGEMSGLDWTPPFCIAEGTW